MKEFADDNFKFDENDRKFSKWVENTVGKGEIVTKNFSFSCSIFKRLVLPEQKANTITTKLKRILPKTVARNCIWTKIKLCMKEWSPVTLIVCCLMPFSRVFQFYHGSQCICLCFPGVLLTSTPHNILSKPLAAFPLNHCQNKGQQWERNESCLNDYHLSSERILAEPGIEPATSRSQVRNTTNGALGLGPVTLKSGSIFTNHY